MNEKDYQLKIYELEKQVERLQSELRKNSETQYGLRWMDVPEAFDAESEDKIPTLEELPEKALDQKNDHPSHLFIEGDNYHALTCLNYTHNGRVDLIYIDPPYNTGDDGFVYKDKRVLDKFPDGTEVPVDHPLRHSYWLSFMDKRLRLAKNLLSKNGFIFISIDDNEYSQLKLLCDSIFGGSNFVASPVRRRRKSQANLAKNISTIHEYVLIYKNSSDTTLSRVAAEIDPKEYKNPDNDPRGPYKTMPCTNKGGTVYTVTTPSGLSITEEWRFKKDTYDQLKADNRLVFPRGGKGKPRYKIFMSEKEGDGVIDNSWWEALGSNQEAAVMLEDIFGAVVFNNPKPVGLIQHILELATNPNSVVLDFFGGSGTTMHAVMGMNAKDHGHRQCILVQYPEKVYVEKEDGTREPKKGCKEAFKLGYNTIAELCFDRNVRVSNGYTDKKGNMVAGLFDNIRYYRTAFVGDHHVAYATDADKVELTQKAGCLLALGENTLVETVCARNYQIFALKQGDVSANGFLYTAIYSSGNLLNFAKFREEIEKIQAADPKARIAVYVFCWGDVTIFENEFDNLKGITLKAIPQPILEIYQNIYTL